MMLILLVVVNKALVHTRVIFSTCWAKVAWGRGDPDRGGPAPCDCGSYEEPSLNQVSFKVYWFINVSDILNSS